MSAETWFWASFADWTLRCGGVALKNRGGAEFELAVECNKGAESKRSKLLENPAYINPESSFDNLINDFIEALR